MTRLRIIHTECHMSFGGQEIGTVREAKYLLKKGHDVVIVCQPGSRIAERCMKEMVPFRNVPGMRKAFLAPYTMSKAFLLLLKYRPHIVHCHSAQDHWIFGFAARVLGIPVVRTRHNSVEPRKIWAVNFLYNRLTDRLITRGESVRKQLIEGAGCRPDRVSSIPLGVDIDEFTVSEPPERTKEKLGLAGRRIVLCVAILRTWKGHEELIRACSLLKGTYPDLALLLVGDGAEKLKLERIAEDVAMTENVLFAGFRDDIPELMSCSDVMVLASHFEGAPQVIPQAWAAGTPVISTPVGGIGEMVVDGVNGILTSPGHSEELASAIGRVLDNRDYAGNLVSGGRKSLEEGFTIEWSMQNTLDIYRELAS